jgi:hypothetical protein
MQHFDLVSQPIYIALSYMWDYGDDKASIICDGIEVQVGQSLHRFLRQFRKACGEVGAWLWIDALCINQNNIRERNHQVAQMKDLYEGASLVIAWLDEATDEDVSAFRALYDDSRSFDKWPWEAWYRLFRKPYWKRIWIIQEFVLGEETHIWCGDLRANSADFTRIGKKLDGVHYIQKTLGWRLLILRDNWRSGNSEERRLQLSLQKLSTSFATSNSTDSRDLIYGLLGIAEDRHATSYQIVPDYAKTAAAVLVDVIKNQYQWAYNPGLGEKITIERGRMWTGWSNEENVEARDRKEEEHTIHENRDKDKQALREQVLGLQARRLPKSLQLPLIPRARWSRRPSCDDNDVILDRDLARELEKEISQDYDFISHLRRKLGVSRAELVRAVLRQAPELRPHIHVMVAKNHFELHRCEEQPGFHLNLLISILGVNGVEEFGLAGYTKDLEVTRRPWNSASGPYSELLSLTSSESSLLDTSSYSPQKGFTQVAILLRRRSKLVSSLKLGTQRLILRLRKSRRYL